MTKSNPTLTSIDSRRPFDDAWLMGVYVFVLCSIPIWTVDGERQSNRRPNNAGDRRPH